METDIKLVVSRKRGRWAMLWVRNTPRIALRTRMVVTDIDERYWNSSAEPTMIVNGLRTSR